MKYLYFSADWCGPCQVLEPRMQRLSERVPVQWVDVDLDLGLTRHYRVLGIPTVILVDGDGTALDRLVGVKEEAEYLKTWQERGGIIDSGDPD